MTSAVPLCAVLRPVSSAARRRWSLGQGGQMNVGVASVDESAAVQAHPGDIVVLKGHSWPGCMG
jgi:hypothetical protein